MGTLIGMLFGGLGRFSVGLGGCFPLVKCLGAGRFLSAENLTCWHKYRATCTPNPMAPSIEQNKMA
jgi:hypothetical protein